MADDIWEQVKRKLEQEQAEGTRHSSTETDEEKTKTDSRTVHIPTSREPEFKERPQWLDGFLTEEDIEANKRKAEKKAQESISRATGIFDKGDTRVTEGLQRALSALDWCPLYEKRRDYRREVMEYIVAFNEINSAYETRDSVDQKVREHVLHTIDESTIAEKEKQNKKEEFLHKTLLAYLGFCRDRIRRLEDYPVPDEVKQSAQDKFAETYQLAYRAVIQSVVLRNKDIVIKTKKEFKKLWDKGGSFRDRSMKVIDELADAFADYFKDASLQERADYERIMRQSPCIKDLITNLEQDTGLKGYASKINS
jgi:hypothetical protein